MIISIKRENQSCNKQVQHSLEISQFVTLLLNSEQILQNNL